MTRAKRPPGFEKSLQELETLVERLERGDLPLEEALKAFERGVALTRECHGALAAAQRRIEVLRQRDGEETLETFDVADDDATDGETHRER